MAVATWKGHVPVVRVLVEHSTVKLDKISMVRTSHSRLTSIFVRENRIFNIVRVLIFAVQGVTPLMNAVKNKSLEMVGMCSHGCVDYLLLLLGVRVNNRIILYYLYVQVVRGRSYTFR